MTLNDQGESMKRFAFWLLAAVFPVVLHAPPALSAVDLFLKIDGIDGESVVKGYEKSIEILSYSWGASNSGSTSVGGGGGAGKVSFSDFSFMKYVDAASSPLAQASFSGVHLNKAILSVVNVGASQPFLTYTMEEVLVSSLQQSASSGGGRPMESVSFNFAVFKMDYWKQDTKGGPTGGQIHAGWDLASASPAPEPSTWALLIGGLALLAWRSGRARQPREG
jgi:type VI secretion system secreted protein Hcp